MRFEPDTRATIAAPRRVLWKRRDRFGVTGCWEREGNNRPRPIFKCGGANMLARLKGGLNPGVPVCLRKKTEEVWRGKLKRYQKQELFLSNILITRNLEILLLSCVFYCFFFVVVSKIRRSWSWKERRMGGKIKIDKSRFGNLSVVSFLKMDLCKRVNAEWYLDCVLYSCDFTDMRKFCGNNALIFL